MVVRTASVASVLQGLASFRTLPYRVEATGRFVQVLEPFKDATVYLSASRYSTLSVLGPVLDKTRKNLEKGGSSPVK